MCLLFLVIIAIDGALILVYLNYVIQQEKTDDDAYAVQQEGKTDDAYAVLQSEPDDSHGPAPPITCSMPKAHISPVTRNRCKCWPCVICGRVFGGVAWLYRHERNHPDCDVQSQLVMETPGRYDKLCEEILARGCRCKGGRGRGMRDR